MELAELVNSMRIVELSAKTRTTAIRTLAQATRLDEEGIELDELLEAVQEREATAQTIVAEGLAMPHAVIDWDGDWRVVLGRSRTGIEFGVPDAGPVHLIAMFFVGQCDETQNAHLELLAALAELLEAEEFRQQLVQARDTRAIEHLLQAKLGISPEGRPRRTTVPRINTVLVKQAIEMVEVVSAQALLLAVDSTDTVPWESLSEWDGRALIVAATISDDLTVERPDTHLFDVPHARLTRMDRANLGLLLAASDGLLAADADVVCVTGPGGRKLDSVTVARPETHLEKMFHGKTTRRSAIIPPAVILRALSLAIELAAEGREAQPVGTMFVIGDARRVMQHTQQMVLNPFRGYSRALRNLLDPSLAETIKEFALIDGAFIVQADGTVLSAGTYLAPKASNVRLSPGLGTRHQAGAAITTQTEAMAITLSQSTGTVTVFRHGKVVLKLERSTKTRT